MAKKPKPSSERMESLLDAGVRKGWIGSYSFSQKTIEYLRELELSENLISDLKDAAGEFTYLRDREEARMAPAEVKREFKRCEKKTSALMECLKGLDSPTKTLLSEQSFSNTGDAGFTRRLEGELSTFRYKVLLPAQNKIKRQEQQRNKAKRRKKSAQRELAKTVAFVLHTHGQRPTMHRNSLWVKVFGAILEDAGEFKEEPFNIIRNVWPIVKSRLREQ